MEAAKNILDNSIFPESAIWRLIDAAGLISEVCPANRKNGLVGLGTVDQLRDAYVAAL